MSVTSYEDVGVIISAVAVAISLAAVFVSWRAFKRTERPSDLQAAVAELQIRQADEAESAEQRAYVEASWEPYRNSQAIIIVNRGPSAARNVRLEAVPPEGYDSPIVQGDLDDKLPISILAPGASAAVFAPGTHGGPSKLSAELIWENEDGSPGHWEGTLVY